jgi:hypothetical protein
VFAGLIAGQAVLVRDAVALGAEVGLAGTAELLLIGAVGGEDVVVRVEDDDRLGFVLQIGDQRLDLRRGNRRWIGGKRVDGGGSGGRTDTLGRFRRDCQAPPNTAISAGMTAAVSAMEF